MESEVTENDVSDPVPSTSHAPGKVYNPVRLRRTLRAKRVPAGRGTSGFGGARAGALVARGSTRGLGRGRGGGRNGGRRATTRAPALSMDTYKSYDNEDEGNPYDQSPTPSLYICTSS